LIDQRRWRSIVKSKKDKETIKQMYEVIYDEMVDACIAISLQIPIFTDINGIPEDHETKRFGLAL